MGMWEGPTAAPAAQFVALVSFGEKGSENVLNNSNMLNSLPHGGSRDKLQVLTFEYRKGFFLSFEQTFLKPLMPELLPATHTLNYYYFLMVYAINVTWFCITTQNCFSPHQNLL